ncbi:MAG: hypothetical protein ACXW0Q_05760 [Methylovulum sp.]
MNNFESNVVNNQEQPSNLPATTADRIAAMIQRVSAPIELWSPAVGDILVGELFDKQIVKTQFGDQIQFIVRTQHGQLISYWLNKYIEQQLQAGGATYGSIAAITYQGKAETSTGKPYHRYNVLVDA